MDQKDLQGPGHPINTTHTHQWANLYSKLGSEKCTYRIARGSIATRRSTVARFSLLTFHTHWAHFTRCTSVTLHRGAMHDKHMPWRDHYTWTRLTGFPAVPCGPLSPGVPRSPCMYRQKQHKKQSLIQPTTQHKDCSNHNTRTAEKVNCND